MAELKDSGARRDFGTGAVRDIADTWKPVVGYEGLYEISNIGKVRSLRSSTRIIDKQNKIMRQKMDSSGYFRVNLYKNGKPKAWLVSQLVALAFVPNVNGLPYVGHDNDIKTDNRAENLYWTNASENLMHNGLHLKIAKKRNIQAVKDALSIPVIGIGKSGDKIAFKSYQEAERNGFSSAHICQCVNGTRDHHKGYKWYKENEYHGIG